MIQEFQTERTNVAARDEELFDPPTVFEMTGSCILWQKRSFRHNVFLINMQNGKIYWKNQ